MDDSHGSRPAREPTDRDGGVPVKPRPTPAAPNDLTTARTSRVHKIIIFVLLFAATLVVFLGLSAGQMPVRMQEFPASWERVASQELELKTKSASERTGISRLSTIVPDIPSPPDRAVERQIALARKGVLSLANAWLQFEWTNVGGVGVAKSSQGAVWAPTPQDIKSICEEIPLPWWDKVGAAVTVEQAMGIRSGLLSKQVILDELKVANWDGVSTFLLWMSVVLYFLGLGPLVVRILPRSYRWAVVGLARIGIRSAKCASSHLSSILNEARGDRS